jgi:hypothetical protein
MKTNQASTHRGHPDGGQYVLRRDPGSWHLTFEGRTAFFKHELGALYVAYLLVNPPREPLHAVALALKARENSTCPPAPDEDCEQRSMGLADAAAVRALWRRQRQLERVLEDRQEIEPVKAEALRELEEVTEFLRTSPWLSRHGADRCVGAVAMAIRRFHAHLAGAVDAEGKPNAVLQAFALHLEEHLLAPSGRGCGRAGTWVASVPAGCFTYEPPKGVVWASRDEGRGTRGALHQVRGPKSEVRGSRFDLHRIDALRSSIFCPVSLRPGSRWRWWQLAVRAGL